MTLLPHIQRDQPPGVPPLTLTGERTLPDVPAENYWFRRHLAVYEWIGHRVGGLHVVDMACGEGCGAEVLARSAETVIGVEANPAAFEHARLRYARPGLSFQRAMGELWGEPGAWDAVTLLQTIEHISDPQALLAHIGEILAPGGVAYISTPNLLTLAPAGAQKSDNPWHLREYRAYEFRKLCESVFGSVEIWGVYHARRLLAHDLALALGWDRMHRGLRLTRPFYIRFAPVVSSSDFRLWIDRPLYRALDFLAVCSDATGNAAVAASAAS
ncbi:MAG: class I SAM-dependent methyltransferase [Solirubrobacteraceae bacterium]